jgi:hypothetical protein
MYSATESLTKISSNKGRSASIVSSLLEVASKGDIDEIVLSRSAFNLRSRKFINDADISALISDYADAADALLIVPL